ncbi:MAG: hypothetical protein ACLTSX_05555 [Collinsella sp.]
MFFITFKESEGFAVARKALRKVIDVIPAHADGTRGTGRRLDARLLHAGELY